MTSPALELQGAIEAVLQADSVLQSLMGNPVRLYQNVPSSIVFPYATFGDAQQLPDKAWCIDGSELYPDIHVWSRYRGDAEIKAIAGAISDALDDAELTLPNHRCVLIERDTVRFFKDSDGLTRHSVLTFRALTEPLN